MAKYKFIYDMENCIGCGSCAALDPENWKMQPNGKSSLKDSKEIDTELFEKEFSKLDKNLETARSCPVNVIHIKKDNEKII